MALQPLLDAIKQMDTGFELPPSAVKALGEHREYYHSYLRQQRQVLQQLKASVPYPMMSLFANRCINAPGAPS